MHYAVFEAEWESEGMMAHHRKVVASEHQGRGREVISLDWTLSHHERLTNQPTQPVDHGNPSPTQKQSQ
jgi:hypothetical protein